MALSLQLQLCLYLLLLAIHHSTSFSVLSPPSLATQNVGFVGNDIGTFLRDEQHDISYFTIQDEEHDDILASLFGSSNTRDDFFKHILGHRVAYFPRTQNNDTTSCTEEQQLEPPIKDIDLQSLYQTNEWTSLRKRGSQDMLDKSKTSYSELSEYISDGGSIVIPITPDDYLFQTKLQIERALGMKDEISSMNIYHSGPSAVALNIHYDSYAVLVLQVTGKKMWMIQNDDFSTDDYKTNVSPESWKNITMTEGDVLYIPKGVLHAATTAVGCDVSTHVTIGLV